MTWTTTSAINPPPQALNEGEGWQRVRPSRSLNQRCSGLKLKCDCRGKIEDFLIGAGASLESRTQRGLTALHMAAMRGDNAVVLALVSGCADIAALENRQRKPADLAEGAGHSQLAAALRQIEAEIIRTR